MLILKLIVMANQLDMGQSVLDQEVVQERDRTTIWSLMIYQELKSTHSVSNIKIEERRRMIFIQTIRVTHF